MKMLEAGDTSRGKWWVGIVMECGHCGEKGVLEPDDEPVVKDNRVGINSIMLPCVRCGLEVIGTWAKHPGAQTVEEMLAACDKFTAGLKQVLSRPPQER